jgi:hypothetical protein
MSQRILAIGAVLAAGALAGCGADSEDPADRAAKVGTPPQTREHDGVVVVRIDGPHSKPLP